MTQVKKMMLLLVATVCFVAVESTAQNVGIGTTSPISKLHVKTSFPQPAIFDGTTPTYNSIYEDGVYRGYIGSYAGADEDVDFGTGSGNNTGKLHLTTLANPKLTIDPIGLVGIGTTSPTHLLHVNGSTSTTENLINANVNYEGFEDIIGVRGYSVTNPGYGIGGQFTGGWRGLDVYNNGQDYGGPTYGIRVNSQGAGFTGSRYAIYATASGGATNWAGYFDAGDVYVNNDLRVGTDSDPYNGDYKIIVDGKIISEEVRIQNSNAWADYVFAKDYYLRPLAEVEKHIDENNHLPGIPSAKVVESEGILVGDMQRLMMEKIEELTLYIIDQEKRLKVHENEIAKLKSK